MSSSLGNGLGSAARWQTYHRQMDRLRERRDRLAVRRLDLALAITALLLLGATVAFLADKSLSFALLDRSADVAINALTVLAAGSLAALALARYREAGRLAGLYQASAFLLIAWVSLLNVAVVVLQGRGRVRPVARRITRAAAAVHLVDQPPRGRGVARRRRCRGSGHGPRPAASRAGRCSCPPACSPSCSSCCT